MLCTFSVSRFLSHTHSLTYQSPPADCKYDYVRKYVRKKIIRFGYVHPYICIRYVRYIQYASSLNHPSSDTMVEQRKEEEEEREVEKKEKKTMPSRRIKSLEKKLGYLHT